MEVHRDPAGGRAEVRGVRPIPAVERAAADAGEDVVVARPALQGGARPGGARARAAVDREDVVGLGALDRDRRRAEIVTSASPVASSAFRLIPPSPRAKLSASAVPITRRIGEPVGSVTVNSISESPSGSAVAPGWKRPPVRSIAISFGAPLAVTTMLSVVVTVAAPHAVPLTAMASPFLAIVTVSPATTSIVTVGAVKVQVAAEAGDGKADDRDDEHRRGHEGAPDERIGHTIAARGPAVPLPRGLRPGALWRTALDR